MYDISLKFCMRMLTKLQATASSRNAAGVTMLKESVSTRRADGFEDRQSKNLSATRSPGFLYLLEVSHRLCAWKNVVDLF
jgi:hypothetical protein